MSEQEDVFKSELGQYLALRWKILKGWRNELLKGRDSYSINYIAVLTARVEGQMKAIKDVAGIWYPDMDVSDEWLDKWDVGSINE